MFELKFPVILASGSPRRKEILTAMGIDYTVEVSDVDETTSGMPEEMVIELSARKARSVAVRHPDSYILAADTLVFGDAEVLGKPKSEQDACRMLTALSGSWHDVYTGMTLINTNNGSEISRAEKTRVHFVSLTQEEIEQYVRTGEPLDKAGSYAIQGMAGMFIDRIEGSYSNVVGLPMAAVREMFLHMMSSKE